MEGYTFGGWRLKVWRLEEVGYTSNEMLAPYQAFISGARISQPYSFFHVTLCLVEVQALAAKVIDVLIGLIV